MKMKKILDETKKIWLSYQNKQDPKTREKLIIQYLPLIRYVIDRLPLLDLPSLSIDDLISSGIIGLIKALDNFDPGRGVKFQTYAIPRIQGAIIDQLRSLDWIPRSLRQKARLLEKRYFLLENKLNRPPTDRELAADLNIKMQELNYLRMEMTYFSPLSLQQKQKNKTGTDMDTAPLMEIIPSPHADNPLETIEKEEIKENLKRIIEQLPEREKKVIILYYYEELTLKEIGEILKISESRVSQIHSKAILHLRAKLKCTSPRLAKDSRSQRERQVAQLAIVSKKQEFKSLK